MKTYFQIVYLEISHVNFTKLTLDTPRYFLWDLCPA